MINIDFVIIASKYPLRDEPNPASSVGGPPEPLGLCGEPHRPYLGRAGHQTTNDRDRWMHMRRRGISHDVSVGRRGRQRPAGTHLAALVAVAASLFLAAGCGGSDDDGVENTPAAAESSGGLLGPASPAAGAPVRIGVITDGQTPFGDTTIQTDVADATAAYLNEHRSGVGGRPIELVPCETLADPGKGADCGNRMIEEQVVAVVVAETAVAENVWEPLHQANMPVMIYGTASSLLLVDTEATFALGDPLFGRVNCPSSSRRRTAPTR